MFSEILKKVVHKTNANHSSMSKGDKLIVHIKHGCLSEFHMRFSYHLGRCRILITGRFCNTMNKSFKNVPCFFLKNCLPFKGLS